VLCRTAKLTADRPLRVIRVIRAIPACPVCPESVTFGMVAEGGRQPSGNHQTGNHYDHPATSMKPRATIGNHRKNLSGNHRNRCL